MKNIKTINMIKMKKMPEYWKEMKAAQWYSIEQDQLSIFCLKDSYINDKPEILKKLFQNQKWEAFSFDKLFKDVIQASNFDELKKKLLFFCKIKIDGIKEDIILENNELIVI